MAGLESLFSNIEEQKKEIETSLNQVNLNRNEILSKYDFSFGEEIVTNETINFLKDQTIRIHNLSNNFYTDLGKVFKETQDQLLSDGIFVKWIENIGFKKSSVYNYINRYKFIMTLDEKEKEKVESLPLKVAYEIIKNTYSQDVKYKVLNGEVKKLSDIKKLASTNNLKKEIKEVSGEVLLTELQEIIDILGVKEKKISKGGSSETFNYLIKIKKLIENI